MKKILSLTLAVLMVVSMIPTAFAADVDYKNGTEVEYTGTRSTVEDDGSVTHNAEYTITVPALLAPGGSGTVTLEGYWPSDATVKVTAEEKVEVVNDINSADKKELAVTFASIEKAGSNTAVVTASAPVSVANIENALFGKWAGKFNYNVEYNGEAGGSGTVTPTPDPEQPGDGEEANLITFTIDGTEYQAEEGWTWAEWIDSDYNTIGMFEDSGLLRVNLGNLLIDDGNGSQEDVATNAEIVINGTYFIFKPIDPNTVMVHDVQYLSSYGETALQWLIFTSDGEIVYGNDIEFPDGTTYGYYTTQGQLLTNDVLNGEFSEDGHTFSAIDADGTTHTYIYTPVN